MKNVIWNFFLSVKNKLPFFKSNILFAVISQYMTSVLILVSINTFSQPPIESKKEKVKQPPIIQPPLPPLPVPTDYKGTLYLYFTG